MADKQEFEALLGQRLGERESRDEALASDIAALGALRDANNDDEHDPDGAPVSSEWSRLEGMRQDNAAEITAIRAALTRLERGEYGNCRNCGQPISEARLRARPMVDLCINCAE